jgi:hypothetical protein
MKHEIILTKAEFLKIPAVQFLPKDSEGIIEENGYVALSFQYLYDLLIGKEFGNFGCNFCREEYKRKNNEYYVMAAGKGKMVCNFCGFKAWFGLTQNEKDALETGDSDEVLMTAQEAREHYEQERKERLLNQRINKRDAFIIDCSRRPMDVPMSEAEKDTLKRLERFIPLELRWRNNFK